jgi:hypothetical protein
MRVSFLPLGGDAERLVEHITRDRGLAERKGQVRLSRSGRSASRAAAAARRSKPAGSPHIDGRERRRHHEDDQQHQDHVDERRDVDLVQFAEIVVAVIEP